MYNTYNFQYVAGTHSIDDLIKFFSRMPDDLSRSALKLWSEMQAGVLFEHKKKLHFPSIYIIDFLNNPTTSLINFTWTNYTTSMVIYLTNPNKWTMSCQKGYTNKRIYYSNLTPTKELLRSLSEFGEH